MKELIPDFFQPHLGLSSIELSHSHEGPTLPVDSELDPIDSSVEARLAAMLEAKNFDRVMLDALKPAAADRSMLKPGMFNALRRDIHAKVEAALGPDASLPVERKDLESLKDLLDRMAADHDLGEHYRYALLKG